MTDLDQATQHDPAAEWNERYQVGTRVRYWPGAREGDGIESVTRTPSWTLGSGHAVVSVEGYPGGIALTHVDPKPDIRDAAARHLGGGNG